MRRDMSFAGAALLTLAVGIGATVAVFSIVYRDAWIALSRSRRPDLDALRRSNAVEPISAGRDVAGAHARTPQAGVFLACLIPALRAAVIDPSTVLRGE
jgi:hypothetical protein